MNGRVRWVLFPAYSLLGGTLAGWITYGARFGLALSAALALTTCLARPAWLAPLLAPGITVVALGGEFYYTQNVLAGSPTAFLPAILHLVRDPILAVRIAGLAIALALVHQACLRLGGVHLWAWALYAGIGCVFWLVDGLISGGWSGVKFLMFLVLLGLSQGIALTITLWQAKALASRSGDVSSRGSS